MQIPPASSAAQAAGIASQANATSSGSESNATSSGAAQQVSQVEQSGDSNPERDAQGQGDGLGDREGHQQGEQQADQPPAKSKQDIIDLSEATTDGPPLVLPVEPSSPPPESSLDLLG